MKRRLAIISDCHGTLKLYSLFLQSISNSEIECKATFFGKSKRERLGYISLIVVDIDSKDFSSDNILYLKSKYPALKVLLVHGYIETKQVYDLLRAGADGFLKRNCFNELLVAVNRLLEGGAYLSTEVSRIVVSNLWINPFGMISYREREVLQLMARGKNYREISTDLEISPETSKSHIRNIYFKLKVDKRDRAISKAREERLII